jgi:hypothetical protein
VVLLFCAACQLKEEPSQELAVDITFSPHPPHVGPTTATFTIGDRAGRPVVAAHITAEADMAHPGMSPVFAEAKEVEPGRYQSTLILGMAGDWVILLHGSLPGGEKLERQFDLKGVHPNNVRPN